MAPPTQISEWTERLLQLLHDPPGKVRYLALHKKLAKELTEILAGMTFTQADWDDHLVPRPDRAAAGADRPCLPWALRQPMTRAETLLATHPLGSLSLFPPIQLGHGDGESVDQREAHVGKREREDQREVARKIALEVSGENPKLLYYIVWRRLRDELISLRDPTWVAPDGYPTGDLFWSMIPADSRCPDVTIWDHTRVTAALSFMSGATGSELPAERVPYLLKMSLTPVQEFIGMARTSRDLWLGSAILAELAFQAMSPFIEQYGPSCILYPDLRANPRMDLWLADGELREALPERAREPSSFAALLPHAFVAVVPRGREDDPVLPDLWRMAEAADQRVKECWRRLQNNVRAWLERTIDSRQFGTHWRDVWDRQHGAADMVRTRWTAVPWLPGGKQANYRVDPASPFSDPTLAGPPETSADAQVRREREARVMPWVPEPLWQLSEVTRAVFGRTASSLLTCERGFDFAVTHAMLRATHEARKQTASWPQETQESGVKCTLCGLRSALTHVSSETGGSDVDSLTAQARELWSNPDLDPEGTGAERLCGICAMRRFAVVADEHCKGINRLWATQADRKAMQAEGKPRVPFPSTSAIAAQAFLLEVVRRATPRIIAAAGRVVTAHRAEGLTPTQFPRSLARLALAEALARQNDPSGQLAAFLRIEPQECVYPDALHAQLAMRRRRLSAPGAGLESAARDFLAAVQNDLALPPPDSRIAAIKLDGDATGRLLDGDPGAIRARWQDVLHPGTLKKMLDNPHCQNAGWPVLVQQPRMIGPSLHAFISRALGEFSHRIVPWVVECEFSGRLIYAGGDDVLALVPADEALDLAARLQQLYSAHWIIDTRYEEDAWFWRRSGGIDAPSLGAQLEDARARFVIPLPGPEEGRLIWPPVWQAPHTASESHEVRLPAPNTMGPVLPVLGGNQSLSAGIVYANMKDGLGGLVRTAGRLLDGLAKGRAGRAAVALADRSRNGEKRAFAMKWHGGAPPLSGVPDAHHLMRRLKQAFVYRQLPSRLPYKLREVARALAPIFDEWPERILAPDPEQPRLLRNSITANVDRDLDPIVLDAVEAIWLAGWRLRSRPGEHTVESVEHTLDGLLLALSLAEVEA